MRVLYLHNSLYMGGAELSLIDVVVGLRKWGVEPHVLHVGENPTFFEALSAEKIPCEVFFPHFFGKRDVVRALRLSSRLREIVRLGSFSLIHANSVTMTKYGAPIAKILRVPLVGHVRDVIRKDYLTVKALGLAEALIAISRFIASDMKSVGLRNVRVVYNGIRFPGDSSSNGKDRAGDTLRIVTPSSLSKRKRVEDAIRCAKILSEKYVKYRWEIVGPVVDEEYYRDLQSLILSSGLGERVKIRAYVEDLSGIYMDSDLVVIPSVAEPFGRVVIEAYRFCKPVVCYATGAFPEIVKNGITGYLVETGDVSMMAEKIQTLVDEGRRVSMGMRGFEFGKENFSLDVVLHHLWMIYEDVTQKKKDYRLSTRMGR